jgi:hypothetical protein
MVVGHQFKLYLGVRRAVNCSKLFNNYSQTRLDLHTSMHVGKLSSSRRVVL